jgi:hypothetical protein
MLQILARQVRGFTLELLEAFPADRLLRPLPGLRNHPLWHAGHALWLGDVLSIVPITGASELPPGWAARFGQRSRPEATPDWPDRAEVMEQLTAQLQRLLELYAELPAQRLADPSRHPQTGWPLLEGIVHGWHDEARHHGEMYALFKFGSVAK